MGPVKRKEFILMTDKLQENKSPTEKRRIRRPFRLSLRYKLAFPTLIVSCLMLFFLFRMTFQTVRALVLEQTENRLKAMAEVFAETVKVPLILKNQQVLLANIEWMSKRSDVLEVRVEDAEGVIVGGSQTTYASLPPSVGGADFLGVKRLAADQFAVAVPIQAHDRKLGRVLIMFSQQGLEEELRRIFEERLLLAFGMALILAVLTSGLTWLAIRPVFNLKKAAQEIVAGDLSARARVNSFDEIQDLEEAFNEMVARLAKSLDNLRSRTEALEESEEKYRLVVDNASDIIFMLAPQGNLVLLNRGFSGHSRDEMLSKGLPLFLSLHKAESQLKFEEALRTVRESKEPILNLSTVHQHPQTKTEIYYLTNLTPVLDHEGRVKLVQGVMRDVTELRRIETMKESLIRDVAHELKTPTAKFEMAVNWFEKEMEKQKEAQKYRQVVAILKSNTDRLSRTISSIMDLSKLESGMYRIEKADLDLNEVLEQVRQDMEPLCRQKHLSLECSFSPEPLPMQGDRDMLYRLFVNLIGNAAKFTEIGKIVLQSKWMNSRVLVEVADSGPGIEKQDLDKIFERFFQKTASSVGIGVGLTICRDIAGLHQGKIWVESEGLGKGSTFKVEFPLTVK